MNASSPKRSKRRSIFSRRKKHAKPLDVAPELEESSESSLEPSMLERDMKSHIGELDVNFKRNQRSSSSIDTRNLELNTTLGSTTNRTNDDRIKDIILSYKSRAKPLSDTPTPERPLYRCSSFKMDGVPAFMSREIEKKARRDADKRRKRQQAKSKAASAQLHESLTALSMAQVTRKQRKVPFLDVPKDHPLHWDYAQLSASDFPERDRAFLVKLFKNPQRTVHGKRLSTRVELTLRKMQLFDWDVATIGRCAVVLFNPDSNPLNLTPTANQYFFDRFDSLRAKLLEGSQVSYMDKTYKRDTVEDLFERLRRDFEDATHNSQEVNQSMPF